LLHTEEGAAKTPAWQGQSPVIVGKFVEYQETGGYRPQVSDSASDLRV
jgi:hypothetical protein